MIRPRTLMGIAVLASGLGLSACSSGTNSASSTTTTKASSGSTTSTSITTTGGADPNGAFCKALAASNATETRLSNALTTAMNTNNLAKVKTAFGPFIAASLSDIQQATAGAPNAPAAVKAAFKTVTNFYNQVKAKVSSATNLTTLQTDITNLSNSKPITDAGNTISGYVTAQCGTASTTSST